jgi:iron complex outermembrane receptor protein
MKTTSLRVERLLLGAVASVALASPAFPQRVDENAIADAEDAFGSNVGGEGLGIYTPSDVRGFSPTDAGNVRIEGLYFDRQTELTSRLVAGNRIRLGPSALNYAFPAPSGIADYRLRSAGEDAVLSIASKGDSFGGWLIEGDALLPLAGERLGIAAGAGYYRNSFAFRNTNQVLSRAVSIAFRPDAASEVKPFWSRISVDDEEAYPIIIGDGSRLPPRMERRRFLGQQWADFEVQRTTFGLLARTRVGGFTVRSGLFRSINATREGYTLLLQAAPRDVLAQRTAIANPPRSSASTSGEANAARQFRVGRSRHELLLSVRGRSQQRIYGGNDRVELSPAPFDKALAVPRPEFEFGERTRDRVRQWTGGLAYQAKLPDVAQVNLGIQRSDYRKKVRTGVLQLPVSRARPWLFNIGASITATNRIEVYGGMTRGLEESDVAPEIAVNRDEAPPALRTEQIDAGVRAKVGPMTLIGGGYRIKKPYYGLDAGNVFRRLGDVTHRGLEFSLSGSPGAGLTVVAGGVLLDAKVAGEEVASGVIGERPVGTPSSTLIGSLDWQLPFVASVSLDVTAKRLGRRFADAENALRVPPQTTVDLGARYRFKLGRVPAVLRLQALNLLNAYGWEIEGNNAFSYIPSRQLSVRLAADF